MMCCVTCVIYCITLICGFKKFSELSDKNDKIHRKISIYYIKKNNSYINHNIYSIYINICMYIDDKRIKEEDIQAPRAAASRTSVMLTRRPGSPEMSGGDKVTKRRRTIAAVRSRSRVVFIFSLLRTFNGERREMKTVSLN